MTVKNMQEMGHWELLPEYQVAISKLYSPAGDISKYRILDPFSGSGEALETFARAWNMTGYANEPQREYYEQAKVRFGANAVHGTAEDLQVHGHQKFADVLYANPPYMADGSASGNEKRIELGLMIHAFKFLRYGGHLIWVVYDYHVTSRAIEFFAQNCNDVNIYLLGDHIQDYKQVVVVGVKSQRYGIRSASNTIARMNFMLKDLPNRVLWNNIHPAPIAMPAPSDIKFAQIFSMKMSAEDVEASLARDGAHYSREIQAIIAPKPNRDEVLKTFIPVRNGHFPSLLSYLSKRGNLILNSEIYGRILVQTSTKTKITRTVVETTKDGQKVVYRSSPLTKLGIRFLTDSGYGEMGASLILSDDDSINEFVYDHFDLIAEKMRQMVNPIYQWDFNNMVERIRDLRLIKNGQPRPLFVAQHHAVAVTTLALSERKGVLLAGQMGVGKTAITSSIIKAHWDTMSDSERRNKIFVIACPPHLTKKWGMDDLRQILGDNADILMTIKAKDENSVQGMITRWLEEENPPTARIQRENEENLKLWVRDVAVKNEKALAKWSKLSDKHRIKNPFVPEDPYETFVPQPITTEPVPRVLVVKTSLLKLGGGWQHAVTRKSGIWSFRFIGEKRRFIEGNKSYHRLSVWRSRYTPHQVKRVRVKWRIRTYAINGGKRKNGRNLTVFRPIMSKYPDGKDARRGEYGVKICPNCGSEAHQDTSDNTQRYCGVCHEPLWQKTQHKSQEPNHFKGIVPMIQLRWNEWAKTAERDVDGNIIASYPHVALPKNPRIALIDVIERYQNKIELWIWDESQTAKGITTNSGESEAFQRAFAMSKNMLALSGTPFNGGASSLMNMLWLFIPWFRDTFKRESADRLSPKPYQGDKNFQRLIRNGGIPFTQQIQEFIANYGVLEETAFEEANYRGVYTETKKRSAPVERPGINPALIEAMFEIAIFLSKREISKTIPDLIVEGLPIEPEPELKKAWGERLEAITEMVKQGRKDGESLNGSALAWKRWTSYPYRANEFKYKGEKRAGYPALWHPDYINRKEKATLELVSEAIADGGLVAIYCVQTDVVDIRPRLKSLIEKAGYKVSVLEDVETDRREAWIKGEVAKGMQVLITAPQKVATGLDFVFDGGKEVTLIIGYESGFQMLITLQAEERANRANSTKPCRVVYPYYKGTFEEQVYMLQEERRDAVRALLGDTTAGFLGLNAVAEQGGSLEQELLAIADGTYKKRKVLDLSVLGGVTYDTWQQNGHLLHIPHLPPVVIAPPKEERIIEVKPIASEFKKKIISEHLAQLTLF